MIECPQCVEHCAEDPDGLAELCVDQAERFGQDPMGAFNHYIRKYHEYGHPTEREADTILLEKIGANKIECADCFMFIKDQLTDIVSFCLDLSQRTRRSAARILKGMIDEQHRRGHPTVFESVARLADTSGCPHCAAHVNEDAEDFGRRATEHSVMLGIPLDEYVKEYLSSWHKQGHPDDEQARRLLIETMGIPDLPCADCRADSERHVKALSAASLLIATNARIAAKSVLAEILAQYHIQGHPSPGEGGEAAIYFARLAGYDPV